ncbi:MAG: hypothetical protein HWE35_17855 [Rhodobacteraceae bacterium]|nr:hypothetical protein [Paracoccaceae bacterium]
MTGFIGSLYGKALGGRSGPLLLDLWREIVRLAEKHAEALPSSRSVYDALTQEFLQDLAQVDAKDWRRMCWGIGPTVYGAVALSWCKDAQIEEVWMDWEASEFPLKPGELYERPALFLNPDLLPHTVSLAEIGRHSRGHALSYCAMICRAGSNLEFDCQYSQPSAIPSAVTAFLMDRLDRKPSMTVPEANLLADLRQSEAPQSQEI